MSYFLFKRVLTLIATLLATSVIVFAVLEVLPGNAAQVLMVSGRTSLKKPHSNSRT